MAPSVIYKVVVTIFMLAVLSVITSCVLRQQSRAANSYGSQGQLTNGVVQQGVPDDLQVTEVVLGLRRFLYADGSLKELAGLRFDPNEIIDERGQSRRLPSADFEINKVFDNACLLVENGKPQQALDFLKSENIKHDLKHDPAYWLVSAYASRQLGDLQGARLSLHEALRVPEMETRIVLNIWKVLRELGDKPEAKVAHQVLGVITEIGYEETVAIVAGYADGEPRLFIGNGGGIIGPKDSFPEATRIAAKELVAAAQPLVHHLRLENTRDLPKRGQVRFVLLTAGGMYVVRDEIANVDKRNSGLYSVWLASHALITPLLKSMSEREGK